MSTRNSEAGPQSLCTRVSSQPDIPNGQVRHLRAEHSQAQPQSGSCMLVQPASLNVPQDKDRRGLQKSQEHIEIAKEGRAGQKAASQETSYLLAQQRGENIGVGSTDLAMSLG